MAKKGVVSEIGLDHDLRDDIRGTDYDVILWTEKDVITKDFKPPPQKNYGSFSKFICTPQNGVRNSSNKFLYNVAWIDA